MRRGWKYPADFHDVLNLFDFYLHFFGDFRRWSVRGSVFELSDAGYAVIY